jgi:hypothetical protein
MNKTEESLSVSGNKEHSIDKRIFRIAPAAIKFLNLPYTGFQPAY